MSFGSCVPIARAKHKAQTAKKSCRLRRRHRLESPEGLYGRRKIEVFSGPNECSPEPLFMRYIENFAYIVLGVSR